MNKKVESFFEIVWKTGSRELKKLRAIPKQLRFWKL